MNAFNCWIASIALHGALFLGAALMVVDQWVVGDGDGESPAFICRLRESTPRIERARDRFGSPTPSDERPSVPELMAPRGVGWQEQDPVGHCCCGCGGAATTVTAWRRDMPGYYDRKLAMATSQRGVPGLKTHGRYCAFRDTGLETDCTCGLIPARS